MRRTPRRTLAAAGTLVVALGLSSMAWADGVTDNTSQVNGSLNPPKLPASGPKTANLFTQVTTYDNDNSPVIPDQSAEKVFVDFPNDMTYTTNSKLPQCDPTLPGVSGDTPTAVATCPNSVIGGGNAIARIPAFPTPNNESELTVTSFNGTTSTAGGGFNGGLPTIVLHADNAALPTTVVVGEIRPSTAGADYGSQLNVPNAPDVAGDAGALVLFNSQVGRKWDNGKSGNKLKKYNLITSTCDAGDLDFKGTWEYDDATTDTDVSSQDCVN